MTNPTAIIARIPSAPEVVGPWRDELDPSKARGMPAHVTVLWPFLDMTEIDTSVIERLREVAFTEPTFTVTFDEIGWFGEDVVFLRPTPEEPFTRLTAAMVEEFPDCEPYDGRFDEVIPHLTVGDGAPPDRMRAAAVAVLEAPSIVAVVDHLTLCELQGPNGHWRMVERLPLAPPRRGR